MPLEQWLVFMAAGVVLNLTPGPDVLYIVTHALRQGVRAGVVAALGITAGCFVHILAAAVGVSALMAASATAFTALKWAGAAYLVYVGVRLLRARPDSAMKIEATSPMDSSAGAEKGLKSIFIRGFLTNALNPKVALFFLAFVPQFIAPGVDSKPLAFLLLGLVFNFNGMWVNMAWAVGAAWLARRAGALQRGMHWLDRIAGAMFVGFGIKLALTSAPQH
jgi:RhtB (resistance to homoserine/threonine) family protein